MSSSVVAATCCCLRPSRNNKTDCRHTVLGTRGRKARERERETHTQTHTDGESERDAALPRRGHLCTCSVPVTTTHLRPFRALEVLKLFLGVSRGHEEETLAVLHVHGTALVPQEEDRDLFSPRQGTRQRSRTHESSTSQKQKANERVHATHTERSCKAPQQ